MNSQHIAYTLPATKRGWLFTLLLLVFFAAQFRSLLFELPNGIHEWAQADRLALAYGYYENGMNFFKPSTLSQFSKEGITGVEFPIQAYIVALIARLSGKAYISLIFRLFDTFIVGLCLFFIYRIAATFTRHFLLAILPPLLLLLSPCFLNYTCSYMPDTVSVSILLVGMGLYLQCWLQQKSVKRYGALFLCTLATLIKTSSGIYLIGFVAYDLYRLYQSKELGKYIGYLVSILLSIAALVACFLYNAYLNKTYESGLFLMTIRPVNIRDAAYLLFERFPKVWMAEYFILPFYIIGVVAWAYIYFLLFRKEHRLRQFFLPLVLILTAGILAVSYLMGSQFIDHDYYMIPILFPFIVLHAFILIILVGTRSFRKSFQFGMGLMIIGLLITAYIKTQDRLSVPYKGFSDYYTTDWMKDGADCLIKANVPADAKIIVLNENPPNLPLVYFDRKGYVLNKDWWGGDFGTAYRFFKDHKVQYGVCAQKEIVVLLKKDRSFNNYFTPIWQDKKMVIFEIK